jgi:uncharacterized membrane protein
MESYRRLMEVAGLAVETLGVLVILAGLLWAIWRLLTGRQNGGRRSYFSLRRDVGRSVLLGLEFLIAGDIIRTVAVTPSVESVAVLGLIILIRTVLSFALHVEVEGRWPWQQEAGSRQDATAER